MGNVTSELEASKRFLSRHLNTKLRLVILAIEVEWPSKLDTYYTSSLIPSLMQDILLIVNKYGGYLLNCVEGSLITFFPAEFDERNACLCAIECAKEVKARLNELVNRLGNKCIDMKCSIDLGSELVVSYSNDKTLDLIGSTIKMVKKICMLSPANSITISENIYKELEEHKAMFRELDVDGLKIYQVIKHDKIDLVLDGKAIVYKAIDEFDLENKDPSYIIKEVLSYSIKNNDDDNYHKRVVSALLHFVLSRTLIPSERNVSIDNVSLDIVIPSVRSLRDKPKDSLVLIIPDRDTNLEGIDKIQPYKDNIWLVYGYKQASYPPYTIYIADMFANQQLKPLSSIVEDIKKFLQGRSIKGFRILPIH